MPEMPCPDAVHHHAGREWVPGIGDDLRQFEPATTLREGLAVRGNDCRSLSRNGGPAIALVPADEHIGLERAWCVIEDVRTRRRERTGRLEGVDFALEGRQGVAVCAGLNLLRVCRR